MPKSDTVHVRVKVSRMIQLNKFEPYTVELEETREDVSAEKAAKVRANLHKQLMEEADAAINLAIKKYRAR